MDKNAMKIEMDIEESKPKDMEGKDLFQEACKALGIQNQYINTKRYIKNGQIVEILFPKNEKGKKYRVENVFNGEMISMTTVGGERAKYLKQSDGKVIIDIRGSIRKFDSVKDVKKLVSPRVTGIIPERKKSDTGY